MDTKIISIKVALYCKLRINIISEGGLTEGISTFFFLVQQPFNLTNFDLS
ncbi:hypothetical protein ACFLVR_04720 [Chloroflexota bacterium]